MQLVLSLFPWADLFGKAFEDQGFCVVRGPDILWGGDIGSFNVPTGKFDGVIGGPPCQLFSNGSRLNGSRRCLAIHMLGNGVPYAMGSHVASYVKSHFAGDL